jgi:hypothetical protein
VVTDWYVDEFVNGTSRVTAVFPRYDASRPLRVRVSPSSKPVPSISRSVRPDSVRCGIALRSFIAEI